MRADEPPPAEPGILYAAAFAIAGLVSAFATPLVVRLALHLGIVDNDGAERRMHELPKPRIGGIAVFLGFAFALFTVLGFSLGSPFALCCRRTINSTRSTASSGCSSAAC